MNWKEWAEIAEDESRWKHREEKGLLKAEYRRDYVLRLWFQDELDVSIYELDFHSLMVENNPGGVFEPLRDIARFKHVRGDYALIWLDPDTGEYDEKAVDIAPECVRFFCEKYGNVLKLSKKAKTPELI
mgnify:CR=1 FL=1